MPWSQSRSFWYRQIGRHQFNWYTPRAGAYAGQIKGNGLIERKWIGASLDVRFTRIGRLVIHSYSKDWQ